MQRSVIKKYGIYSTFLFVVIFLSVLSVVLILTGILFPTGMETVYITVYCSKLVCTRFPFRHSPVWFYLCLHDSFFQNTTFVYMNSIAAFRQYYSSFPFIFSSFIMASLEPNTIFC